MKSRGAASDWEFRWRFPILIASQPALALLVHVTSDASEPWYAPAFSAWTGWIAASVATLSILLRVQATTALHARVMASDDPDTSRFVTQGIYRAVRNPLYVSSLLLFGAYALFFGWSWTIGFVAFHVWRYRRIVRLEEHSLRAEWGTDFDDYCRTVPRWIPRWTELSREFGRWWSWQGMAGNSVYVAFGLGIVVSAWQQNLTWVIPFEIAGGLVMAAYYASRPTKSVVANDRESATLAKSGAPTTRHASALEPIPVPHFAADALGSSPAIPFADELRS